MLQRILATPFLVLILLYCSEAVENDKDTQNLFGGDESWILSEEASMMQPWQRCDAFMAPTNTSTGWGVFAARDFEEMERVDITPLYLGLRTRQGAPPSEFRAIKSTMLEDYVFGFHLGSQKTAENYRSLVIFGYEMMFNHHPTGQNLHLGYRAGASPGHYTKRKVKAGEELYASYGQSDGGNKWFGARNLTMANIPPSSIPSDNVNFLSSQYCTKIYAGAGSGTYSMLIPNMEPSRVAPFEAGLYNARAKVPITAGERIEQAPAMVLYRPFVKDTALAGLVITWDGMLPEHQKVLQRASDRWYGKLPIQYHGPASDWERLSRLAKLENVAFLPFAGRIGTVRRVGGSSSTSEPDQSNPNCRMNVHIETHANDAESTTENTISTNSSISVVLELIATKDIFVGELLAVNLHPEGNLFERELLKSSLKESGHPEPYLPLF